MNSDWLKARMSEPSTWAGAALIASQAGGALEQAAQVVAGGGGISGGLLAVGFGIAAMFMRDPGGAAK